MSISWAEVQARFPSDTVIAAMSSTVGAMHVATAEAVANAGAMGHLATQVHAYLSAHYATLAASGAGGGASGPVSSVSAGPYSKSYAVSAEGSADLGRTGYGIAAKEMMSRAVAPVFMVG